MEFWDNRVSKNAENLKVQSFLEEIIAVCRKHKLSISHEDGHGSFLIEDFSESNASWLMAAAIDKDCKSV